MTALHGPHPDRVNTVALRMRAPNRHEKGPVRGRCCQVGYIAASMRRSITFTAVYFTTAMVQTSQMAQSTLFNSFRRESKILAPSVPVSPNGIAPAMSR